MYIHRIMYLYAYTVYSWYVYCMYIIIYNIILIYIYILYHSSWKIYQYTIIYILLGERTRLPELIIWNPANLTQEPAIVQSLVSFHVCCFPLPICRLLEQWNTPSLDLVCFKIDFCPSVTMTSKSKENSRFHLRLLKTYLVRSTYATLFESLLVTCLPKRLRHPDDLRQS